MRDVLERLLGRAQLLATPVVLLPCGIPQRAQEVPESDQRPESVVDHVRIWVLDPAADPNSYPNRQRSEWYHRCKVMRKGAVGLRHYLDDVHTEDALRQVSRRIAFAEPTYSDNCSTVSFIQRGHGDDALTACR